MTDIKQDIYGVTVTHRSFPGGRRQRLEFEFPETDAAFTQFYDREFRNMLAVIKARYGNSLKTDDIEDICIMSFNDLKRNIDTGRITRERLTVPLRKYLERICLFKADKYYERMDKVVRNEYPIDMQWGDACGEVDDSRIDRLLGMMSESAEKAADTVSEHDARLENMVRDIVESLPAPCSEIFIDHYWGGLTYKTIAVSHHFPKPGAVKMTASRCHDKFFRKVEELKMKIGYRGTRYAHRKDRKEKK